MNINKLKGKMVEREITRDDLAKALSKDASTISRKMSNGSFSVTEAKKISLLLELSTEDACDIFLA